MSRVVLPTLHILYVFFPFFFTFNLSPCVAGAILGIFRGTRTAKNAGHHRLIKAERMIAGA